MFDSLESKIKKTVIVVVGGIGLITLITALVALVLQGPLEAILAFVLINSWVIALFNSILNFIWVNDRLWVRISWSVFAVVVTILLMISIAFVATYLSL